MASLKTIAQERLWLCFVSTAWVSLALATYHTEDPILQSPVWWISTGVVAITSLYFVLIDEPAQEMVKTLTALVVVYSLARSIATGMEYEWNRSAFWLLYASLTLHAYRLGAILGDFRKQHTDRCNSITSVV